MKHEGTFFGKLNSGGDIIGHVAFSGKPEKFTNNRTGGWGAVLYCLPSRLTNGLAKSIGAEKEIAERKVRDRHQRLSRGIGRNFISVVLPGIPHLTCAAPQEIHVLMDYSCSVSQVEDFMFGGRQSYMEPQDMEPAPALQRKRRAFLGSPKMKPRRKY